MSDQERAAAVIRLAIELMRQGRSRGWSDALAMARAEIRT
jgi:hypothetical protein